MPVKYLDAKTITSKRQLSPSPPNRSRTGYGSKIPSSWELKVGTRWHRVYVMIWSNSGSAYIVKGGEKLLLGSYDPNDP